MFYFSTVIQPRLGRGFDSLRHPVNWSEVDATAKPLQEHFMYFKIEFSDGSTYLLALIVFDPHPYWL